jgi:hypothetical protein
MFATFGRYVRAAENVEYEEFRNMPSPNDEDWTVQLTRSEYEKLIAL